MKCYIEPKLVQWTIGESKHKYFLSFKTGDIKIFLGNFTKSNANLLNQNLSHVYYYYITQVKLKVNKNQWAESTFNLGSIFFEDDKTRYYTGLEENHIESIKQKLQVNQFKQLKYKWESIRKTL